jgi:hypothetical protein
MILYGFPYEKTLVDLSSVRKLVIVNIILIVNFLGAFIFHPCFHLLKNKTVNSLVVLKNMDLELLASFTIFYIIMTIFYDYEIYKFTETLLMISVSAIKYYILSMMFFVSIFASKFIFKYNMHKINMVCITILLFMLLSTPFWGDDIVSSSICWFIIATALYLYFCSNLLMLAAKFTHFYLQLAIILYALAGAVGYYCSYIIADNVDSADNEYNFLISICFVLAGLLTYYLYRYRKNNLGRW